MEGYFFLCIFLLMGLFYSGLDSAFPFFSFRREKASPSFPYRPTDNGCQERWYRTAKEKEIYCYPTYPTSEIARLYLGRYIQYYNEKRPHRALWNYPPGYVRRLRNKSKLLAHNKTMVQIIKEERLQINRSLQKKAFMAVSN